MRKEGGRQKNAETVSWEIKDHLYSLKKKKKKKAYQLCKKDAARIMKCQRCIHALLL